MDRQLMRLLLVSLTFLLTTLSAQILAPIVFAPGHHAVTPPTSNMVLWISADCMTTISPCTSPANGTTNPTVWKDRSPAANDLAFFQLSSGNCTFQTNQINTQPAMSFAANGCSFRTATAPPVGFLSGRILNVFMVYKRADSTTTFDFFECATGGLPVNCLEYRSTSSGLQTLCNPRVACYANGTAGGNSVWNQINFTLNYTAATASFRLNRASDGSTSGISNFPIAGDHVLGIPGDNDFNLNGQIAEMIFYAGTGLTSPEITQVETYLNTKYGL